MDLAQLQAQLKGQSPEAAPVHLWDPPFCGDMDIVIKQDGTWCYNETPITREKLIALFSTVLKKEGEKYFLVTPVEKVGIRVEDVPFLIIDWELKEDLLIFTTKEGIKFTVDEAHPVELRFHPEHETELPYVKVRDNLFARLHQNTFYQLVSLGELVDQGYGKSLLMVSSGQYQFSLGEVC